MAAHSRRIPETGDNSRAEAGVFPHMGTGRNRVVFKMRRPCFFRGKDVRILVKGVELLGRGGYDILQTVLRKKGDLI